MSHRADWTILDHAYAAASRTSRGASRGPRTDRAGQVSYACTQRKACAIPGGAPNTCCSKRDCACGCHHAERELLADVRGTK